MVKVPLFILRTYRSGDFYVDICANDKFDEFEAWLYHKDYGVKSLMVTLDFKVGLDNFVHLVETNLLNEIDLYRDMYLKERS